MKHVTKKLAIFSMAALLASCGNPISSSTSGPADSSAATSQPGTSSSTTSNPSSSSTGTSSQATSKEALPAIDYVKVLAPKNYTHIWA